MSDLEYILNVDPTEFATGLILEIRVRQQLGEQSFEKSYFYDYLQLAR